LRLKYFTLEQEGWQVTAELHNRIQWSVANLIVESEVAALAASDIIFCQNVFIYFSEEKIRQTIHLFAKLMPDRGYLFTDKGDFFTALVSDSGLLELQKINGTSLWVKRSLSHFGPVAARQEES
jgi:chemotaxis protein methyltransferase CheR